MRFCANVTLTGAFTLTLAATPTAAMAANPTADVPPVRADVEPQRFRLRTGSLELGVGWRPEVLYDLCGYSPICGLTPRIGFDFEFGSRAVRLVVGSYHAPVPIWLEPFMIEVGVLFGGTRVRGGIIGSAGAIHANGAAVLRLSPWVDRHGHRHGLDLQVSTGLFQPLGVAVSYRFYPRKLDRKYPS